MPESRVPLGKPLDWSDEDLEALAEASPQEKLDAQAAFRRDAARLRAGLLDAVPDDA